MIGVTILEPATVPVRIVLEAEFPGWPAAELFAHWSRPELLVRWFPTEAEVDLRPGGAYRLAWPAHGYEVRGRIIDLIPGADLRLTWQGVHDPPSIDPKVLWLRFLEVGSGSLLKLSHGPYSLDRVDEQRLRAEQTDAWKYYFGCLEQLRGPDR